MPELPEVETIRKGLSRRILNKEIADFVVLKAKSIKGSKQKFLNKLKGNAITKIERRGKLLIFTLAKDNNYLLIHLKVSGQLIYNNERTKHTRVIFKFTDGSRLLFNDLRLFGYLKLVDQKEKNKILDQFGPEALSSDFTLAKFQEILKNRKTIIKPLLMNQSLIAGIGNIYADETLFDAGVRPDRRVNTLKNQEIAKIFKSIKKILRKSVKQGGTSVGDYLKADGQKGNFAKFLKVYQKEGKTCSCARQGKVKRIKLAGRGTRFCPECQK